MTELGRYSDNGGGDVVALAVGQHGKSGRRKAERQRSEQGRGRSDNGGGGWKMCREQAIRSGQRNKSGRDEDGVAAMMAAVE